MLKSLECSKIIENGVPRGIILFTDGLNTLLGEDDGTNSIGKSTFLLLIDYCFGGETYNKNNDISSRIGHHAVQFVFSFDGIDYRFVRTTQNTNAITYTDSLGKTETWELERFTDFLKEKYHMPEDGSFRGMAGLFLRIYEKENCSERHVLRQGNQPESTAIPQLEKLFGVYAKTKQARDHFDIQTKTKTEYKNIQKSTVIRGVVTNKTQYNKNEKRIKELEGIIQRVQNETGMVLTNDDADILRQKAVHNRELQLLKRCRNKYLAKLAEMSAGCSGENTVDKGTFNQLLAFFPGADIAHLEEIQSFHTKITAILKKEREEEKAKTEDMLQASCSAAD